MKTKAAKSLADSAVSVLLLLLPGYLHLSNLLGSQITINPYRVVGQNL